MAVVFAPRPDQFPVTIVTVDRLHVRRHAGGPPNALMADELACWFARGAGRTTVGDKRAARTSQSGQAASTLFLLP